MMGSRGQESEADLGIRVHAAIGKFAARCQAGTWEDIVDTAWVLATEDQRERPTLNARGTPTHDRGRATRLMVAGYTAGYGQYFLPTDEWTLLGAELQLPGGRRCDLAWVRDSDQAVVIDEIKTDVRPWALGRGPTADQMAAIVAGARETFGNRFLCARLLYVAAPRRSLVWYPDGRVGSLEGTELWFEGRRPIRPRSA